MRYAKIKTPLYLTLFIGLPLLPQGLRAAEAPQIVTEDVAEVTEPVDPAYGKAEEECIAQTETTLKQRGLMPSEESAEYDAQFEALFAACMQLAGFTQSLPEIPEEPLPPSETLR